MTLIGQIPSFILVPASSAASGEAAAASADRARQLAAQAWAWLEGSLGGVPAEIGLMSMVAFVGGLILWLKGARVVKPLFATGGLLAGGAVGFLVLPTILTASIADVPSPYVGLAAGSLLGLIAALLVLRFTLALAAAAVVGAASALGAAAYLQHHESPIALVATDEVDADDSYQPPELVLEGVPVVESLDDESLVAASLSDDLQEGGAVVAERVRTFASEVAAEGAQMWADVPLDNRLLLTAAAMSGAALGLLFGLAMPNKSAAIVTATAGSALWLTNAAWIGQLVEVPGIDKITLTPTSRLVTWGVVALIGIVWQFTAISRRKRRAVESDEED